MASAKVGRIPWSGRRVLVAAVGVGLLLAILLGAPRVSCVGADSEAAEAARDLYAIASGLRHKNGPARARAARMLARHSEGGPWLVLLLLSSQTPPIGDEEEQLRQKDLHPSELGKVAVALDALPKDVDPAVLWAVTYLLNEKGEGIWAEKSGVILIRKSSHRSRPIRELARAVLKGRLGVDHGWDASAWRTVIANKTPGPAAASQPASSPGP